MQHHEVIAGYDLVEQMGRPQHADVLFGHQLPDMVKDVGARLDIQPDGRLVQQQQARPMQQFAGNFQPSHLAAREVANLAAGTIGEPEARQHLVAALTRITRAMPCRAA